MKKVAFKTDKYRKARGGYSRFLDIFCASCGTKILTYQKDGPGPLKRLYLDRIVTPNNLSRLRLQPIREVPNLICPKCKDVLGIPYIYSKEKRGAIRLFVGSVIKRLAKR